MLASSVPRRASWFETRGGRQPTAHSQRPEGASHSRAQRPSSCRGTTMLSGIFPSSFFAKKQEGVRTLVPQASYRGPSESIFPPQTQIARHLCQHSSQLLRAGSPPSFQHRMGHRGHQSHVPEPHSTAGHRRCLSALAGGCGETRAVNPPRRVQRDPVQPVSSSP